MGGQFLVKNMFVLKCASLLLEFSLEFQNRSSFSSAFHKVKCLPLPSSAPTLDKLSRVGHSDFDIGGGTLSRPIGGGQGSDGED